MRATFFPRALIRHLTAAGGLRAIVGTALAALVATAAITPAKAENMVVTMDQASIMRLARPAATVVIGNPSIADASVQNRQMLVVTGKSFGSTNLIVLDAEGGVISESILYVRNASRGVVTVHRGQERVSLTCAPVCERTLTTGDGETPFKVLKEQIEQRNKIASGDTSNETPEPPR